MTIRVGALDPYFDEYDGITVFDGPTEVDLAWLLRVGRGDGETATLTPEDVREIEHSVMVYDSRQLPAVQELMRRIDRARR